MTIYRHINAGLWERSTHSWSWSTFSITTTKMLRDCALAVTRWSLSQRSQAALKGSSSLMQTQSSCSARTNGSTSTQVWSEQGHCSSTIGLTVAGRQRTGWRTSWRRVAKSRVWRSTRPYIGGKSWNINRSLVSCTSTRPYRGPSWVSYSQHTWIHNVCERTCTDKFPVGVSALIATEPQETHTNATPLGDKETFWLAAELAKIPYAFHPSYAGIIGSISTNADGVPEICSPQPLQTDLDGRPFWFNSGLMEDKTNAENRKYANLTYYIPGGTRKQPVGGWRFIHDHTFCMGRSVEEMRSVKDAGLEEVAKGLIDEAKAVDEMFRVSTGWMLSDHRSLQGQYFHAALSVSIAILDESWAYYYLNYDFTRSVLSLRTNIVCMTLIDNERQLKFPEHLVNLHQIQDLLKHVLRHGNSLWVRTVIQGVRSRGSLIHNLLPTYHKNSHRFPASFESSR